MPHDVSLISTLAAGFALALAMGFVASRLKVPPLVGYLLAGVAIASLFSRPRRLARAGGRRAAGLAALGSELALAYAAQALAQTRDAGRTVRSTAQGLQRQASTALGEGADRIETIGRALRERLGKEAGGR